MSGLRRRFCIFGCDVTFVHGVPLHRFPNPDKQPDLFAAWKSAVGDKLQTESDNSKIYKNKRICDYHFESAHKTTGGRLIWSAVPTINLQYVPHVASTFVDFDHNYCRPRRECQTSRPLVDITNMPTTSSQASSTTQECLPSHSRDIPTLLQPGSTHDIRSIFDSDKTREQIHTRSTKKIERQMKTEIRRLRIKIKTFKMRLLQTRKLSAQRHFEKITQNMSESAKLFTRMQFIEGRKKKKGRRFTLQEKILALSIFKKSPKGYKLMTKYFTLPSKKILKSLLSHIRLSPGINNTIFDELKRTVAKMLPQDRLCTLLFDEMSILPQVHYNLHTDDLVGFENYGNEKTANFCNHVLVFMLKGVKKNFKQPLGYYFTQTLKTTKLKEILIDVIKNVQATGLKIIATVCDQSTVNVSTINSLISDAKLAYLSLGKEWRHEIIIVNNREIIPLFDVPHLLKGIRNNLINKEMRYMHENNLKIIKWEYFQRVFQADRSHGELRILPKITNEHIDPGKIKKMKVKHAAQVLSHSMAVATDNLAARNDIPVECRDLIPFVLLIDKLFDSLNSSSFVVPHGKIYRAATKRNSPHHELWQDALKMLKTVKFIVKKSDGEIVEKSVPTVNNLIRTIEGFKVVWQLLYKKYNFNAMLTRNFNQDPLENFFGSIRSLGARNVAPNCVAFEGAFKTLLLNNFSSNHSINANCEADSNDCLQSLEFLIKNKTVSNVPAQSQSIIIDKPLNLMQDTREVFDLGADQRTYVCGWILMKCLQKVVKGCKTCKSYLLGCSDNPLNKYIQAKEYTKKKWLCYPSDSLVNSFQEIQETTVAFLNSQCYKALIQQRIKIFIEMLTDLAFISCEIHKEKLKQYFTETSINIIIYSWCRTVNRILSGKIKYEGMDPIKKAAQIYYQKHSRL